MSGIWNKRSAGKRNTIQNKLTEYLRMVLWFLTLAVVTNIGFGIMSNLNIMKENETLLQVDHFFELLSDEEARLFGQTLSIYEADPMELREHCEGLCVSLGQIREYRISTEFQRDTEDLTVLLEEYREKVSVIADNLGKQKNQSQNVYLLNELRGIYETMSSYYAPLSRQVIKNERRMAEKMWQRMLLYIVFLIVTLLLFITYMVLRTLEITRAITGPVHELTKHLENIDFLNPSVSEALPLRAEYHEEINQMIRVYNEMLEKTQKQVLEHEELMNTKLLLQRQELLNLQQQINPHFLFNTLNMISQSAYIENSRQTVGLIETTANLLRYSLDYSDKEVTLQREIEAVGNYVQIQEQRFGDRILFVFDLDETFHQIRMPSLTLQPLLENAVVHGVGMYGSGGEVRIRTRWDREAGFGLVSIIDNGVGMDEEARKAVDIRMRQYENRSSRIGLANVYFRLKLFFGQKADIRICSEPGRRTEFTLLLPYEDEEKKGHVYTGDCG